MGKISSKNKNSEKIEKIEKQEHSENSEKLKVLFLGGSGVGKTCIISQFVNGYFDPFCQATMTAQYIEKKISFPHQSSLTLELWDTLGSKKYIKLTRLLYTGAKAVILVYDSTCENSFKELKEFWYNEIKSLNVIIVIAANKCDLTEKEVKDEEGKEFADSIGAIFASISAKNNIGIRELIQKVAEAIKNNN